MYVVHIRNCISVYSVGAGRLGGCVLSSIDGRRRAGAATLCPALERVGDGHVTLDPRPEVAGAREEGLVGTAIRAH